MFQNWPEAKSILEALDSPLKKAVFEAALKDFDRSDSPLRVNNLATALRELIRLVLRDLAPDASIKACCWYEPELDQNGKEIITRSQRVQYAVQGGLPTDFVENTLHIDVKGTKKDFSHLTGDLSKLTHIEEKTFDIPDQEAQLFAEEALDIFGRLFETVSDCQALTQSAFEDYARDAVSDELTENVQNALDQLATHHNISQVNVEDVSVEIVNLAKIKLSVSGSVGCELQYGSDSDNARGDGARSTGYYPFTAEYTADIRWPDDLTLTETVHIDNSSFYE
jgi:hypothetical protein